MNKRIVTLVIALTLPMTVVAFPGNGAGGGRFEGHRAHRVERLAKKLELNDEQKAQLEVIFKEQREKLDAIHRETRERMQGVLSPEQMIQLDELKKRRHEKWQQRREEWKNKKRAEPLQ